MEYQIGTLSIITRLTVKTLRYYHETGLLEPSRIDPESGYRYYNEQSVEISMRLKKLRDLDFSIKEIQKILEECHDDADLIRFFERKRENLQEKLDRYNRINQELEQFIQTEKESEKMNEKEEVTLKTLSPLLVISKRYKGRYDECGKVAGELYRIAKGKAAGGFFNRYWDDEYKERDADIEVCLPVKSQVDHPGARSEEFPGGEFLTTLHRGPYDGLGGAYKRIHDYAQKEGLVLEGPCREHYHKGPGMFFKGNPKKYLTEIQFPFHK